MADQDVLVTFGAKIDQLVDGVNQVKAQLGSIGGTTDKLAKQFGFLEEIPKKLRDVAHFVVEFATSMGEAGVRAERMQAMLGATGEQLGFLKSVAAGSGTDFEALAISLERMTLNAQRSTVDGLNPTAQALKTLGLQASDLIGKSPDEVFLKLADATSKFAPSLNLTNALMQIGGRNIAQIIPALHQGSEKMKEFAQRWKDASSGIDVTKFATTHTEITLLNRSVDSIGKVLYAQFQPAIEITLKALTGFVTWIKDATKEGGLLEPVLTALAWLAKGVAIAFNAVLFTIEGLSIAFIRFWNVTHRPWTIKEEAAKASTELETLGRKVKETMDEFFRARVTVEGGGKAAPAINYNARDQLDAFIKAQEMQIQLSKGLLEQKKIGYDSDVGAFRNTELQKILLVAQSTQQQMQIEADHYRTILARNDLTLAQRRDFEGKITLLQQQMETERLRSQQDFVRQYRETWTNALTTISGAFNSQIDGLLKGTTTWAQAMQNVFRSLITTMISALNDWVAKWIAAQIAEKTATEAAQGATLALKIGRFESDLGAASALAAANAYAAYAAFPPAAAAAAAAAVAAVEGLGQSGIPKFATGAWEVPGDMVAQIHKGEMIVPAQQAEAIRQGGNGPSSTNHFNVGFVDTAGAQGFISRYAGPLAAAISNYQRLNPSSRPAF